MEFLADLFGYVVRFIYEITQDNYALSIILFTVLSKVLLFPLSLKQVKSSVEIQKVKPKYDEIMKKYKNNKEKQAEEVTKLYSEHKINPMGGCLPLLLQLPLILAMFYIVRQPLTYVIEMPKEEIKIYAQQMLQKEEISDAELSNYEIAIAKKENLINMNFLGLNFGDTPSDVFNSDQNKKANPISVIVPILSVLFSVLQIRQANKNSQMTPEQKEMQKSMNIMMPLFSGFLAFTMPLALGVYWTLGSICQILQQSIIYKMIQEKEESLNLLSDSKKGE